MTTMQEIAMKTRRVYYPGVSQFLLDSVTLKNLIIFFNIGKSSFLEIVTLQYSNFSSKVPQFLYQL